MMNRYKFMSYLLILLGAVVIVGSGYLIYSYASTIISAIVNFISTNDYSKLTQCGVNTPPEFNKVKADFATVILPFFYVGLPVILILVSYLMFMAGFYFHRGKEEDDAKKHEELEREMVHKIVNKMQTEKPTAPAGRTAPPRKPAMAKPEPEEEEPQEEEEAAEEEPAEEEPEEEPQPKPAMKKKK
jgi:type IV secretory pathway VirB10-like protein